ncbi:BolA family transcriptional regulator [Shewanella sp. KJ2020]|uniref:BolA family protein n=1 Tax=Shewanella sp. KJ2020 TaxID=2919172 RepID=UPI0020A74A0D|nr:BolA/IbaG family iron-sulfur metabolism protein [Shewanella sp. KJ2020]MCP3129914.1 BolA/IbaG family iron-sulfur metabolism protein [Shewanella sp. KJ2020]
MSNMHTQVTVTETITQKLTDSFSPIHLEVLNESHRHHVPPNSETHFKVVLVSEEFDGLRLLARHRLINNCLAHELATGVHALSIHTFTPSEWDATVEVPRTPNCRG